MVIVRLDEEGGGGLDNTIKSSIKRPGDCYHNEETRGA